MYGIRAEGTESTDAGLNHSFLGRKQAGLSLSSLLLSILNFSKHPCWGPPTHSLGPPRPCTAVGYLGLTLHRACWLALLQTCGTPPGASCSETECGGPNCRTDEGEKKCGGPGCGGLVTVAHGAWQKAMDFDRDVLSALAEVEQLSKMVIQRMAYFCWLSVMEDLRGRNQSPMLTKKRRKFLWDQGDEVLFIGGLRICLFLIMIIWNIHVNNHGSRVMHTSSFYFN